MTRFRTLRLVVVLTAVDIALFVVSGISSLKNAHHGADAVLGEIVWVAFLAGVLALAVTLGLWATKTIRARRAKA